jgi:hypothetical protein
MDRVAVNLTASHVGLNYTRLLYLSSKGKKTDVHVVLTKAFRLH